MLLTSDFDLRRIGVQFSLPRVYRWFVCGPTKKTFVHKYNSGNWDFKALMQDIEQNSFNTQTEEFIKVTLCTEGRQTWSCSFKAPNSLFSLSSKLFLSPSKELCSLFPCVFCRLKGNHEYFQLRKLLVYNIFRMHNILSYLFPQFFKRIDIVLLASAISKRNNIKTLLWTIRCTRNLETGWALR